VLKGHHLIYECEHACLGELSCEGIVWHDTEDGRTDSCYLRTNISLAECISDRAFNLRVLHRIAVATAKHDDEERDDGVTEFAWPAWAAFSATNCYLGRGGDVISGKDPVQGHQSLHECQELCLSDAECDAIVMHDTQDWHKDNCWLHKNIKIDDCEINQQFNVWLSPAYDETLGQYRPHKWTSLHSTNCYPGQGAENINGQDVLKGHHLIYECEHACLGEPSCEGIVWHDTQDGHTDNCYLCTNISLSHCTMDDAVNLRVLTRAARLASTSTTSVKPTTTDPSLDPEKSWHSWSAYSATNCYSGRGALQIEGKDPVPGRKLLKECQEECMADASCDAIVMHDTEDGLQDNCWLRSDVAIDACEIHEGFDLWLSPAYTAKHDGYRPHAWTSHHSTNCFPGHGATHIARQAALSGHNLLFQCESACLDEPSCEGIVWHDTKDGDADECFPIGSISLSDCEADPSFNVRLLNLEQPPTATEAPGPTPAAAAAAEQEAAATNLWHGYSSTNCYAGRGGESIQGRDPVPGQKTLTECQEECLADAECDAILLHDASDDVADNCWLSKGIVLDECDTDPVFGVWLSPAYDKTTNGHAVPHEWTTHHGLNCPPGEGAKDLGRQAYVLGRHLLFECESACLGEPKCEGIVWRDTPDGYIEDCFLRGAIHLSACWPRDGFSTRLLQRRVDPTSVATTSAIPAATTTAPASGIPGAGGWTNYSGKNCYEFNGADNVGGSDPLMGHKLLKECREECLADPVCDAIVMQDDGPLAGNCWLRKNVTLDSCQSDPTFTVFLSPPYDARGGYRGHVWTSHPRVRCHPGHGGEPVDEKDALDGHRLISDCEDACLAEPRCAAVVWRDTRGGLAPSCFLRSNIELARCEESEVFNLRILMRVAAKSTMPADDAGVLITPISASPWTTHPGLNCYPGHGADPVERGTDVASGQRSLEECQHECLADETCEGIMIRGSEDLHEDNCWLRKNIALDRCERDAAASLWLAPGFGAGVWEAHDGVNCYPGNGADMVNNQDMLFGHLDLSACQDACVTTQGCEGFILHETADTDTFSATCYLRAHIDLAHCERSSLFRLRIRMDLPDKPIQVMDDATLPMVRLLLPAGVSALGAGLVTTAFGFLLVGSAFSISNRWERGGGEGYSAVSLATVPLRGDESDTEFDGSEDTAREELQNLV